LPTRSQALRPENAGDVAENARARRLAGRSVRAAIAAWRAINARLGGLPQSGRVRVSYGHARVPRPTDFAVGGVVKLQALDERFPNSPRRFNLLYLVSSRLPDGAVTLARAARSKGAMVVFNQNGVGYPGWHGPGWERINEPMAALMPLAAHVFYQSRFCKETADRFLGVQPSHWEILYNAVDTDRFVPAPPRADRPLTLLLGGTQYARYRVDSAVRTLALVRRTVPDVRLLITGTLRWPSGTGTPRSDIDRLACELGVADAIEFLGPYAQADAVAMYQKADILLHTKYKDPCPTVVIEALSCGLPVVYSSSGGVPELVGDDCGAAVPVEQTWDRDVSPDPEALCAAVLQVRGDLGRLAMSARRRACDRFDVRTWLARHADVFERLTK
jgi:glycosyltransferase involved in cell wall biosynthesis